jgi:RND family efflux transporter MFP subunit
MRMRLGVAAIVVGAALTLAGCKQKAPQPPSARPVVAGTVHAAAFKAAHRVPGEVAARFTTPLSFRIAGKLIERRVHLGDAVTAGQVLSRLDPADAQKNAASAAAQSAAAESRLRFAQQQLDRDRAQAAGNLISKLQLEQTEDNYASALAQRDSAVQQAALARDQLAYTTLAADHAGVIASEQADTGANLSAGQPVYQLAWAGAMDVICDVPERMLASLRLGIPADVTLAALPGQTFSAKLRELSPAADPSSRTYRAKLTLSGADGRDVSNAVRLGMTAEVTFRNASGSTASQSVTLPATALFHSGDKPAVWVVRQTDDLLELRTVTVAGYGERTVEVSAGLADGEQVVLQGVHTVSAGEKVRPVAPLRAEDGLL